MQKSRLIGLDSRVDRPDRKLQRWPGGTHQVFEDVEPRAVYRIVEGAEVLERVDMPTFRLGGDG